MDDRTARDPRDSYPPSSIGRSRMLVVRTCQVKQDQSDGPLRSSWPWPGIGPMSVSVSGAAGVPRPPASVRVNPIPVRSSVALEFRVFSDNCRQKGGSRVGLERRHEICFGLDPEPGGSGPTQLIQDWGFSDSLLLFSDSILLGDTRPGSQVLWLVEDVGLGYLMRIGMRTYLTCAFSMPSRWA